MHLGDHFARADRPTLSFEFFPAKTVAATTKLHEAIKTLAAREPAFISLTYGAGGSTRHATQELVRHVKTTTTVDPVPHFTCVNHGEKEINETLQAYAALGIRNILALRGDAPRDCPGHDHQLDFCRQAADLVRHMRSADALVVMKTGRNMPKVRRALEAAGRLEAAWLVERGTMPTQRVVPLAEVDGSDCPYFAIVLVHGQGRRPEVLE